MARTRTHTRFGVTSRALAAALLVSSMAGACASNEPKLVQRGSALTAGNGVSLNGVSLNGVSLNGVSLNGVSLNGVSLNGVSLNGVSLTLATSLATVTKIKVQNGQLVGLDSKGKTVKTGAQLVGASLKAALSDGREMKFRIDAARALAAPNTDVWSYDVSYQTDQGWFLLCGAENGAPIAALAMAGTWDASQGTSTGGAWTDSTSVFTWACANRTVAKCTLFGYKPWLAVAGASSLRNYHQACTRMLRADYCGDGTPHTVDGTVINLYDNLGIASDTQGWLPEAEWRATGASCVGPTSVLRLWLTGQPVPDCVLERTIVDCGTYFRSGSLLITEYGIPTTEAGDYSGGPTTWPEELPTY